MTETNKNRSLNKNTIVFLVDFFCFLNSYGQQLNFKVNFVPLLDKFNYQSIRFSSEIHLLKKYSVQLEYGVSVPQIMPQLYHRIDGMNSMIGRVEFRYYVNNVNYISLDFFGKNQHYTAYWHYTASGAAGPYPQKWINVTREVYTINLLFGEQEDDLFGVERLLSDYYFGVGVRCISVRNDLNDGEKVINPDSGRGHLPLDNATKKIWPNIVVGCKIGYRVVGRKKYLSDTM